LVRQKDRLLGARKPERSRMPHPLDRPAWSALSTSHAHLSIGNGLAKRYPPSIVPFAATENSGDESLRALEGLVGGGDEALVVQADEIALPAGLVAVSRAAGVQMVADKPFDDVADARVEPLTEDDAADMLALASLTRPGPFSLRALALGEFWGVKLDGRLVAMAGERMKVPGYTELSGVCSHPEVRGKGLGRLLSLFVARQIFARGDRPFLHAYARNATAIALYRSIGFELRTEMNVVLVRRAD
jgi:ribosomal protein S18 acetylase RimI-like enzyme